MTPLSHPTWWRTAALALGAAALTGTAAHAAPMFDVQAIAYPPDPMGVCEPVALTDAQWIVVDCNAGGNEGAGYHRTLPGAWVKIPAPPGKYYNNYLKGANEAGVVIGGHEWENKRDNSAYTWSVAGGYRYLTRATQRGYLTVEDINDAGQVVGEEGHNAMLWNADGSVAYRDPQQRTSYFDNSYARVINNAAEVIVEDGIKGKAVWTLATGPRAVWANGHKVKAKVDLNNAGQLVGTYLVRDDPSNVTFQRVLANRDGTGVPIGPQEPLDRSSAMRVNDSAQVTYQVGSAAVPVPAQTHYWDAESGAHDITTLINPASPLAGRVELISLGLINNQGEVLAAGKDTVSGKRQLYLFMPMAN